jgi:hypothetical protein
MLTKKLVSAMAQITAAQAQVEALKANNAPAYLFERVQQEMDWLADEVMKTDKIGGLTNELSN